MILTKTFRRSNNQFFCNDINKYLTLLLYHAKNPESFRPRTFLQKGTGHRTFEPIDVGTIDDNCEFQ